METGTLPGAIRMPQRLAMAMSLLLLAAPLTNRFGLLPFRIALLLVALAVAGAGLLLLATLIMLCLRRYRPWRARLGITTALAALPVAVAAMIVIPGAGTPMIHDISTDILDPPQFVAALVLRGPDSNPLQRGSEIDRAQQHAYATIAPIETTLEPAAAFARAQTIAASLGWQIHAADVASGLIETSVSSFWFGFVDDIAIRVRGSPTGSRIDLRSVSRVGKGDLGANARRIQRFQQAFTQN